MSTRLQFLDLPTELRIMIWRAMVPPRVVEISWQGGHYTDAIRPVILDICRESRGVALEIYDIFKIQPNDPFRGNRREKHWYPAVAMEEYKEKMRKWQLWMYIDYRRDTILLRGPARDGLRSVNPALSFLKLLSKRKRFQTQGGVVALDILPFWEVTGGDDDILRLLKAAPSVMLIYPDGETTREQWSNCTHYSTSHGRAAYIEPACEEKSKIHSALMRSIASLSKNVSNWIEEAKPKPYILHREPASENQVVESIAHSSLWV